MKALVTGAGGFLGSAISRQLLERGATVRGIARSKYPQIESIGVTMIQGDIADYNTVLKTAQDCDIVFHTASKTGVWGSFDRYYKTNVTGTENIIKGCQHLGINRLVYTSTPSVTFEGRDEKGVNETEPYADKFLCHYPATKARAEKMVLDANDSSLATCALRPHLIWGPGDPHLVPRIIDRARKGKLRLIGKGNCLVDSTYIDNAACAHLLAADHLQPGSNCAGRAYYISNDQPLPMAELINKILNAANLPPVTRKIPAPVAYMLGAVMEAVYKIRGKTDEPLMTRFVARQLSTAHWFNISAAKKDLGYKPEVSIDEGMERLKKALSEDDYRIL